MTDAGLRPHLVRIQRATISEDDYGGEVRTWHDLATGYARVRYGTGQERREAAQENASQVATFEFDWSPTLAALLPSDRLLWFTTVWDIASAVIIGGNKEVHVTAVANLGAGFVGLEAAVHGTSGLAGTMSGFAQLEALLSAQGSVEGDLTGLGLLAGDVGGSAQLAAAMSAGALLAGSCASTATLSATGTLTPLIYAFTVTETSGDGLWSNQGVAAPPDASRLWVTGGINAITWMGIQELDPSDYSVIAEEDLTAQLPADADQMNGIVWHNGELYAGLNNYNETPKWGAIVVIDPDTRVVLETHVVGTNWCEGCVIRGTEAFVYYHDTHRIDVYDLATWTLQDSHDTGFVHLLNDASLYQGGGFSGDYLLLNVHNTQTRPKMIDVMHWDADTRTLIPKYRIAQPLTTTGQGFVMNGEGTAAYFANRDGGGAEVHRVVKTSISSTQTLSTPVAEGAIHTTGLIHHWPELVGTGAGFTLPDVVGGFNGTVGDGSQVYPILDPDHGLVTRMAGVAVNSYIDLGILFPVARSTVTIMAWLRVTGSGSGNFMQGNASGSVAGDWLITINHLSDGRLRFFSDNGDDLISDVATYALNEWMHVAFVKHATGTEIWKNGVLIKSNAQTGNLGGNAQVVRIGSNDVGAVNGKFNFKDLRVYSTAADVAAIYADLVA